MTTSIPYTLFEEEVSKFASRRIPGYKQSAVQNLLLEKNTPSNCLITKVKRILAQRESVTADDFAAAVKETVESYSNNKDNAIDIFKRLQAHLLKNLEFESDIDFPPIPVSNTFERLMFISKYLQDPEKNISDLSGLLWVSSRTIEDDLAKLRGNDDDPIQICGKKYIIKDMNRKEDRITDMASTPHPFFLTCNLTEVIITLQGLKKAAEDPASRGYAEKTAASIWEQLSEYAKKRILYVSENIMPTDISWYESLEKMTEEAFWPEYYCSSFGENAMLDCLKNGKPCYIEYQTDNGTVFYTDVTVKKLLADKFLVEVENQELELVSNRILKSSTGLSRLY